MRISTKGRYGLRALVDLAMFPADKFTSLSLIAKRLNLSVNYLEHSFSALKKAGLVKSVAGPNGGYKLAYSPEDITVYVVLSILEGNLAIRDPIDPGEETTLQKVIRNMVWDPINQEIHHLTSNTTLQDLVDNFQSKTE